MDIYHISLGIACVALLIWAIAERKKGNKEATRLFTELSDLKCVLYTQYDADCIKFLELYRKVGKMAINSWEDKKNEYWSKFLTKHERKDLHKRTDCSDAEKDLLNGIYS